MSAEDTLDPTLQALLDLTAPVPTAPQGDVDWPLLVHLAGRHKSVLLLARGLDRVGSDGVPAPALEALRALRHQRLHRAMILLRDTIRLSTALSEAGVVHAILKGAPLSQQIYGDPLLRDPGDIDLKINEEDLQTAAQVMAELGYEPQYPKLIQSPLQRARAIKACKDLAFLNCRTGLHVECHLRLMPLRGQLLEALCPLPATCRVPLGGQYVPALPLDLGFLYTCIHGAKHGWFRLKWLNDLRWSLVADIPWSSIRNETECLNLQRAIGSALEFAALFTGTTIPEEFLDWQAFTPQTQALAHHCIADFGEHGAAKEDQDTIGKMVRSTLSLRGRVIASTHDDHAILTIMRSFVRPSPIDLARVELPRGLGIGYLPIRFLRVLSSLVVGQGTPR